MTRCSTSSPIILCLPVLPTSKGEHLSFYRFDCSQLFQHWRTVLNSAAHHTRRYFILCSSSRAVRHQSSTYPSSSRNTPNIFPWLVYCRKFYDRAFYIMDSSGVLADLSQYYTLKGISPMYLCQLVLHNSEHSKQTSLIIDEGHLFRVYYEFIHTNSSEAKDFSLCFTMTYPCFKRIWAKNRTPQFIAGFGKAVEPTGGSTHPLCS